MEIPMKCLQFENALSEIARGDREPRPEEVNHLEICQNCSDQMKLARQLQSDLQMTGEESQKLRASSRVQDYLLAELRKRNTAKPPHLWMWRISRIAAVLLLVALTASWIVTHRNDTSTASIPAAESSA